MNQAVKWISNVLLGFVILTVALFFITPHLLGVEYFTIYSGSMMPTISVGSVVVVKPVEVNDITAGEIITFKRTSESDAMVTHRVVEVLARDGSPSFRTGGDANESPDGSIVPAENVIGKVLFDVPVLGYISSFVRTKLGFLLLMVLPALFIVGLELKEIIRQFRLMDKPAGQAQPLKPAPGFVEQPVMVGLVSASIPEKGTANQPPAPIEKLPESPPIANIPPIQEPEIAEAPPIQEPVITEVPSIPEPVKVEAVEPPAAAETLERAETTKKNPDIQAEASRIVDEIIARVRAERAAKQQA